MHFLYSVTIYPLELAYKFLYLFLAQATGTYSLSLIYLSLVTYAVLFPLKKLAASMQERERRVQAVLAPQLAAIRARSRGAERQAHTAALYRRYAYHPLMALRSSAGILLQVPFICAAYAMLSSFEPIRGQSAFFGLIPDLGAADGLIGGVNALPLLMTGVNLLAVFTTRGFNRREKLQGGLIALLFLILLYHAPAALLIYWTGNNILMLLENIIRGLFGPARAGIARAGLPKPPD
jgi:membrane protein insertase Oxa1/YidC/SpoIIIJ